MTAIQESLDSRDTLVLDIEFTDGEMQTRCPASMWWFGTSLLWADPGWPTSPGHAFHLVTGKLSGTGPWVLEPDESDVVSRLISRITIRPLVPGEQPATEEFLVWETYRSTPEGKPYTTEEALKAAAAALDRRFP